MPRPKRRRSPASAPAIAPAAQRSRPSALAASAPTAILGVTNRNLSSMLFHAVRNHVVNPAGYSSATGLYLRFCKAYTIAPWPATDTTLAAWVLVLATSVAVQSIPVYLSGVRHTQRTLGVLPAGAAHEYLYCALRFVKRKFGMAEKQFKFSVTLKVLRAILPLLPGWPTTCDMSHDDRMFAAASMIGVMGCLRGGEFLLSSGARPLLLASHVQVRASPAFTGVVISVVHPKAKWWLLQQDVSCFALPSAGPFCVKRLYTQYTNLSEVELHPAGAAFLSSVGAPLTRDVMVARTEALLALAGITQLGPDGKPTRVHSSSWRAGAVRSARDADISDPVIMSWGRWSSSAWTNYLSQSATDLHQAALAAWRCSTPVSHTAAHDSWMGQSARSALDAANLPGEPEDFEASQLARLGPSRQALG
jgi:hypothetical protein